MSVDVSSEVDVDVSVSVAVSLLVSVDVAVLVDDVAVLLLSEPQPVIEVAANIANATSAGLKPASEILIAILHSAFQSVVDL